jgi:hypothetical protein
MFGAMRVDGSSDFTGASPRHAIDQQGSDSPISQLDELQATCRFEVIPHILFLKLNDSRPISVPNTAMRVLHE